MNFFRKFVFNFTFGITSSRAKRSKKNLHTPQIEMLYLCVACTLLGAVVFLKYLFWRQKYTQSIPGRKHRFYNILGDLKDIDLRKDLRLQIIDIVGNVLKSFPKEQLVTLWLSIFPVVLVIKSDSVREVLKTNKLIEKSFQYEWLKPVFGTGLATSEITKWKSRRRLLNPCFHSDVLRNYLQTFNEMSQKLVKVLQKETQEDFTNIADHLTFCALDAVCETIFGIRIEVLDNHKMQITHCFKRCEKIVTKRMYSFWLYPDFIFMNSKYAKEGLKHVDTIQEFIKKMIQLKKNSYLRGERSIYNGKHKGLIDVLLEKHLDTKEFSEEDVIEEVLTFMTAGHETIVTALTWAIYLIGHHPGVQAKLHEEVDRVFGEDRERAVTEEDLKNLRYLDCVLKESNRLYPAVPVIGRHVAEATKICDSTLPKGTAICIVMYFLNRDEDVFPDPEKFDPDRFSAENRVNIPEFAYIPFSAGPRNCIGYKFGEMEMGTIMSYIFRNFTVESLNEVRPVPGISLHASEPVRIKIRSRAMHKT